MSVSEVFLCESLSPLPLRTSFLVVEPVGRRRRSLHILEHASPVELQQYGVYNTIKHGATSKLFIVCTSRAPRPDGASSAGDAAGGAGGSPGGADGPEGVACPPARRPTS